MSTYRHPSLDHRTSDCRTQRGSSTWRHDSRADFQARHRRTRTFCIRRPSTLRGAASSSQAEAVCRPPPITFHRQQFLQQRCGEKGLQRSPSVQACGKCPRSPPSVWRRTRRTTRSRPMRASPLVPTLQRTWLQGLSWIYPSHRTGHFFSPGTATALQVQARLSQRHAT